MEPLAESATLKSQDRNLSRRTVRTPASATAARPRRPLIPALVATGACGLAAAPAAALQLGDLEVHSSLGQPLRASIAYALRPGEQLSAHCIFLKPAMGFPAFGKARISVDGSRIHVRGATPIKEPIAALRVSVDCAYTANLTRDYMLMLDPVPLDSPLDGEVRFAGNDQAPSDSRSQQAATVVAARPIPRAQQPTEPVIGPATTYRTRPGDSLSGIASRIADRPVGLWSAVEQIFAENADAFIDGDMNRLKAGATLVIPAFDTTTPVTVADAAESPADTAPPGIIKGDTPTAYDQPALDAPAAPRSPAAATRGTSVAGMMPIAEANLAEVATDIESRSAGPESAPGSKTTSLESGLPVDAKRDRASDLAPGDVFLSSANTAEAGTDPAAAEGSVGESGSTFRWPLPLGGVGILAGAALLLFRRRSRRPQTPPPESLDHEDFLPDDAPTLQNRALSAVDFDVSTPDESIVTSSHDAELEGAVGLSGKISNGAEDTGIAVTYLDHEDDDDEDYFDAVDLSTEEEAPPIIIPKGPIEPKTILESEILPSDDDYSVSMVMDATKHKFSDDDVTAKQLEAVAVANSAAVDDDEYTLSNALEYDILEQDYEDELSATQALNMEIMEAAEELRNRLNGRDDDGQTQSNIAGPDVELTVDVELTASDQSKIIPVSDARYEDSKPDIKLADETCLVSQETSILPSVDLVEAGEEDCTMIALAADLALDEQDGDMTTEVPAADPDTRETDARVEASGETSEFTAETTAQLPVAENDETAEMSVESGVYHANNAS